MKHYSKPGSTLARPVARLAALAVLILLVATPVARADGGVGGWPPPIKTASGAVGH